MTLGTNQDKAMADTTQAPQTGFSPVPDGRPEPHAPPTAQSRAGFSPAMDAEAHESTYNSFVHFTTVASLFVIGCVVGLAVGGIKHAWLSAIFGIVLVHVAAAVGLFAPSLGWKPGAAAVGLLLLMLVFF